MRSVSAAHLFHGQFHNFQMSIRSRIIGQGAALAARATWLDSHSFLEMRTILPL
jgi:hypothetical protein